MEIFLVTSFEKVLHYGLVLRVIRVYCIMVALLDLVLSTQHFGKNHSEEP